MIEKTVLLQTIVLAGLAVAAADSASAGDPTATKPWHELPGVDDSYRIVHPMPEPEDADPASSAQFRIGDMDVRIGGSVTVDVGAGNLPRPR